MDLVEVDLTGEEEDHLFYTNNVREAIFIEEEDSSMDEDCSMEDATEDTMESTDVMDPEVKVDFYGTPGWLQGWCNQGRAWGEGFHNIVKANEALKVESGYKLYKC